ncbi:MAG: hypothetical protein WC581_05095 [Thermodesulfovibrionales bacterium]
MKNTGKFFGYILLILILLTFLAVQSPSTLNADTIKTPPKVVMGVIEEVTFSSIQVNGKFYDISNVPIVTARGIKVDKDQLKQGKTVEIIIEGDNITRVVITKHSSMH